MRYAALPSFEENFLQTANNGEYKLQRISIPVPNEALKLEGWLCTPQLRAGYYYNVAHPKQRIVIHYTAGSLRSDIETLTTTNRHVSVPFVIARDGSIYQLFSSKFWSGHLGKGVGNMNTGNAQDKCTIAIELSNYGWLTERFGNLETCYSRTPGSNGLADVYCTLTDTEAYEKVSTPFRGQSYFATFSEAQYQSLIILLRYLTTTYNIPRQFLPESLRYQTTNDVLNFQGIVSHVNYRIDGKWDIGPAFNWNKVMDGVQAATFHPVISRDVVARDVTAPITSEEQVDALLPTPQDAAHENESYNDMQRTNDTEADMEFEKSSRKAAKKKLYALLVGVDDYKEDIVLNESVIFPKLSGCVPDAERMQSYLEHDPAFDANIKLITNEQATKDEIARLFKEHLGQAKKGDTAVFFFSGHGTQEWADMQVWKEDTDGKLECIVCYYNSATDNKLLADKELRYLLHDLAQTGAHVVALFDCCHSGDNTRALVQETFSAVKVKAIPYVFPKRSWSDFLFNEKLGIDSVKQQGEGKLLPEGAHVQFSACESDESALEVSGSGVFTQTLLQVLKAAGGDVSYQSLSSRIRQYLKNVYEQKPRVYAVGDVLDLTNTNFLDRPVTGQKRSLGELVYNEEKGWKFTLGAIHGITAQTKSITITDPDTDDLFEGIINTIEIDSCYVTTDAKLRKTKIYNGAVETLFSNSIKVCFEKQEEALKEMQQLMDVVLKDGKDYVVPEEEEQASDYVVHLQQGNVYITRPADPFRPLSAPLRIQDTNTPKVIAAQLVHMAQWTFLKNLQNTDNETRIPDEVLKIDLTVGNEKQLALDNTNTAVIQYNKVQDSWENSMTVTLNNTAAVNLYCSVLYLTSDFSSDTEFLNPTVYMLEPGNSVNLSFEKDSTLTLELNEVVKYYNWKEEVEYLKFIVSTEPFDVQALSLDPLPKPPVPGVEMPKEARGVSTTRGIRKRTLSGWGTQSITLRLQNPLTDNVSDNDKIAMLENPGTSAFAQGLYPDVKFKEKKQDIPQQPTIAPSNSKKSLNEATGGSNITREQPKSAPAPPVTRDASTPNDAPPILKRLRGMFKKAKPEADAEANTSPLSQLDKMIVEPDRPRSAGTTSRAAGSSAAKPPSAMAPAPAPPQPVSKTREGQLEYDIPGQMQTDKPYECRVAIAGAEVAAASMKLGESSVHEAIRVAEEMSVQLIDCSGGACFTIVPLNTERQSIDEGEQTRWSFEVTPKQSGNHCLVLKITMHQNGKNKDLDILEKEVLVQADGNTAATLPNSAITRILFLASNPSDTTMLRVGAETRQIKEEIAQAKDRDHFLFTTNFAVTTRTLSRAIVQEDPAIVHFSGHGDEDGLCLETEGGLSKVVDASALDALFKNFADSIKCVILNACYSKTQALAIVQNIPFVIGMSRQVADDAALAFSVGFYQALVDGWDIEKAFNLGQASMALTTSVAQDVAVLLKKPVP